VRIAIYILVALLLILIMGCEPEESLEDRVTRESQEQFEKISKEVSERVDRETKERIGEYEQEKDMAVLWIQDIYLIDSVINDEKLMEAESHRTMWFVMLGEEKAQRIELVKKVVSQKIFTVEEGKVTVGEIESKHDNLKGELEVNYNEIGAILEEAHKQEGTLTRPDYETIVDLST